jgi:PAS domain S-box-containing protein
MGAIPGHRSREAGHQPVAGPAKTARRPPTAHDTAALVQFAIDQVLRSEPGFGGLPDVLERLADTWEAGAALALAVQPDGTPVKLGGYPDEVAGHRGLPAAIMSLVQTHPATAAAARAGGSLQAPLAPEVWPGTASALIAWAAVQAGEQRCALVLVGDPAGWDAQTRSTVGMLAAVVAAQLRHAGDLSYLQEREAVTRALIEASPDAVLVMDAERQVVAFNPAAEALFGWKRSDVLGKDMPSMLIPERDRPRFLAGTESFLAHRDPGEFTGRMNLPVLRADGGERLVELTPLPLVVRGQVYFCGFLRDLSEIEQAKAALAATEAHFRTLVRRAPVGIAETGPDGRCVFVNDRWCVLNGGAPADFVGHAWLSVVHPDDLDQVREAWKRTTAGGAELEIDCRLRVAGQPERWAHATVGALPGHDEDAPGFVITLSDMSRHKEAEREQARELAAERRTRRALTDHAERVNSLIALAIPAIVVADQHGLVTQVNESFRGMFEITEPATGLAGHAAALLARRIAPVLADPAGFVATMDRLVAERRPVTGLDLACANGQTIECDYWPTFVAAEYRGGVWLFWDMTERKQRDEIRERELATVQVARRAAEADRQRLASLNERLREVDELKTHFLATVSHELRGPLTSIVSYTELISDEKERLSPELGAFLGVIERSAEQLTRLVGDLLLLSRIEAGVTPLELAPVSIRTVVTDALRSAAPAADRAGVELQGSAEDGPPVQADPARLRQVVENLLSNAIKFSADGGTVRVAASCGEDEWRIEVADSGLGIPAGEVDRIFERFFRASNGHKAQRPGSGLGLAVVKALTELHGGRVEVTSTVGRGSAFSVFLPLPRPAGRGRRTPGPGAAPPHGVT